MILFESLKQRTQPKPTTVFVLKRKRLFIFPTRFGLFFFLGLGVMLVGSMNYDNNMGYLLTFLLGSMSVVSMFHTHRNLLGLRLLPGKVEPVFVGEPAHFEIWIDNEGQAARYALAWQHQTQQTLFLWKRIQNYINPLATTVIDIAADQRQALQLTLPTQRRGRLFLEQVMVYTRFPLGLFHAWAYIQLDMSTLVYPHPSGQNNLPSSQQAEEQGEGTPHMGSGDDFIGYRDYQLGDSPRHIDWKAVAREQKWLIKQFGGLSAATVWFTWAQVSHLPLEGALSQLCLWIVMAEKHGAQYGLKIPGHRFEPNRGEAHYRQCLQTLALYQSP